MERKWTETPEGARIPKHVAVIMDGNGRWAREQGKERWEGHREGVESVRRIMEAAGEAGVRYLTLYTFSKENWNRPQIEVEILMGLIVEGITAERDNLMKNNVRIRIVGCLEDLSEHVRGELEALIGETAGNTGLTVVLALSYGARWELVEVARKLARGVQEGTIGSVDAIDESYFEQALTTAGIPDPDLLIRTGGECRISNFLLWQIAYTELYFIEKFWPDFQKEDLYLAIRNFQQRERRFGKTGEQLKK